MKKFFERVEVSPIPLWKWIGVGGVSVFLFYLLSKILSKSQFITFDPNTIIFFEGLLFYLIFFSGFFLLSIILIQLLSGKELLKVTKVFFTFSSLLILIPIIDRLFGVSSLIRFRESFSGLLRLLISAFHPFVWSSPGSGVTPGIKIVVLLSAALGGYYIYLSRGDIKRSIMGFLIFLGLPILFNSIPLLFSSLVAFSAKRPYHFVFHEVGLVSSVFRRYGLIFLFISTAVFGGYIYKYNRVYWRSLFKNLLSFIGIEFSLLVAFGFGIGFFLLKDVYILPFLNPLDYSILPGMIVGSLLLTLSIKRAENKSLEWFPLFLLALLYFLCINYSTMFTALFVFSLGILFYSSPLRLGRFKVINSLSVGILGFLFTILGFTVFGQGRSFLIFPTGALLITLGVVWILMELRERIRKGWVSYFIIALQVLLGALLLFSLAKGKIFQDKGLAHLLLHLLNIA